MARWFTYRCLECGYEVQTDPHGKYMLMSGEYENYMCPQCKEIVSIKTYPVSTSNKATCPECGCNSLTKWNPVKCKCPKCKGKMVKDTNTMILAD